MNLSFLLERRRLVVATAFLLALAGAASWVTMPREEDPRFPKRNGLVVTAFPGADAETVERLVIEPLEEHLAEVEEIKEIGSTSRAGVGIVNIELLDKVYDTEAAWDEVRDALDKARPDFPSGVFEPELNDDLVSQEAVVLAITGSSDPLQLVRQAKWLKRQLLSLQQVKQIKLVADPGEQITVEYDTATARRLGVDPAQLGRQLSQRSSILPGGLVHLGAKTANLRPMTEFSSVDEIRRTPIMLPGGTSVPLSELARVRQGPREPAGEWMRWNGEPAVGLGIIPKDSIDRVAFGEEIRARMAELRPQLEPLRVEEVTFQPDMVQSRLEDLTDSLKLGIFIVAGLLFITMGVRLGLLVALVLPLVTFGSIAIFATGGGILHQISIAALVIALGMLVDNAIVVVENIQWRLDQGHHVRQAAADAVRSLALPLGTATGTTLAAFVPMLLAKGGTADFTRSIPILIMLTLAVSYLFAVTVTPVLSELVLRRRKGTSGEGRNRLAEGLASLAVGRAPWMLVMAAVLMGLTLWAAGGVEQNFFPAADRNVLLVDLQMPEGTHLERTDAVARQVETELLGHSQVTSVASFIGRAAPHFYYNLLPKPDSPHRAQLVAETTDLAAVDAVAERLRELARGQLPDVELVTRHLEQGPPIEAPIEIRVLGDDLQQLEAVADTVLAKLRTVEGARDVRHDLGLGVPTLVFQIDDAAAARHGLARSDVASELAGRTLGTAVGQYRMGDDPVPILVRSSAGEKLPVEDLVHLDMATPGGASVPLSQLARLEVDWRPAAIQHFQRQRMVKVMAQVEGETTAIDIFSKLEPQLAELDLPAGVSLMAGGELEESGAANEAMLRTMPLGILLLLFFLLVEFNSFRRVGIILMTVPLAAIGVVPGLLLSGQPFGFMSMLGVISLVGIVVNNAIVLLDVVENLRGEGLTMDEALVAAIKQRTRPIFLTMMTTVAGLSPLAFSDTTLWPPLAWAMISGLLASTVLTLLVVPALYKLLFWQPSKPLFRGRLDRRKVAAALALVVGGLLAGSSLRAEGPASPPIDAETAAPTLRLSLDEALERAAERPRNLAGDRRAVAEERGAKAAHRAAWWPTVGASADLVRRDRDFDFATPLGDFTLGERTSEALALEVRQPLFDPARALYGVPAARSAARASRLMAQRLRQESTLEAAQAYLNVLALDARLDATRSFVDSLAARLTESEERVKAGRILEAEALKVRLDLESAELELRHLEAQRRTSLFALGRAVGYSGAVEPQALERFDRETAPSAAELIDRANRRPDVRALEEQVGVLWLRAQSVRAERLPSLSARATWQRSSGDPFRPEELLEGALAVTWRPFAGGTRAPRAAAFEAEGEALKADLEEIRRGISLSVRHSLEELEVARSAVDVRLRGYELASETLRVERERYAAGRSTTNDLLDAESSLRRRQTESALAQLELLGAWLQLDVVVGDKVGG